MSKLTVIKNVLTSKIGRAGLKLSKHSPEILMVTGIVGVVAGTVMACRATLKVDEVLTEAEEKLERINNGRETISKEEYPDKDYKKDLTVTYVQTGFEFVKLYGPAMILGVAGIGCIVGSHNIMKKRNLALVAAYKLVEESFTEYRKRVIEDLGEDKDREYKYGIKTVKVTKDVVDENGNIVQVEETQTIIDEKTASPYARYFDDKSIYWNDIASYNLMHLRTQERYANDLLQYKGHVFLNEVYDCLGIKRTPAGAVTGWVKGKGDDRIDFNIYNFETEGYRDDKVNDTIGEERRDFVNGYNKPILLDFNVDGVIYDLI